MAQPANAGNEAGKNKELSSHQTISVEKEVRKILYRYMAGITTILALISALGYVSIRESVYTSVTSATNEKLKAQDIAIDKATNDERNRIMSFYTDMQKKLMVITSDAELNRIDSNAKMNLYFSETKKDIDDIKMKAARLLNEFTINELERLKGEIVKTESESGLLSKRVKRIDTDLLTFHDVVTKGAEEIAKNPVLARAVAEHIGDLKTNVAIANMTEAELYDTSMTIQRLREFPTLPFESEEIAEKLSRIAGYRFGCWTINHQLMLFGKLDQFPLIEVDVRGKILEYKKRVQAELDVRKSDNNHPNKGPDDL